MEKSLNLLKYMKIFYCRLKTKPKVYYITGKLQSLELLKSVYQGSKPARWIVNN